MSGSEIVGGDRIDWDAIFMDYLWGAWIYAGTDDKPVHVDYPYEALAQKYECHQATIAIKASAEKWRVQRDQFRASDQFNFINYSCEQAKNRLLACSLLLIQSAAIDSQMLEAQAIADSEISETGDGSVSRTKLDKIAVRSKTVCQLAKTAQLAFSVIKEVNSMKSNNIDFTEVNLQARRNRIDSLQKQVEIARRKLKKVDESENELN